MKYVCVSVWRDQKRAHQVTTSCCAWKKRSKSIFQWCCLLSDNEWRILFQYKLWGGNSAAAAWEPNKKKKKKTRAVKYTIFNFVSFWFITFLILHIHNQLFLHFVALNIIVFSSLITIFHINALDLLSHSFSLSLSLTPTEAFNIIFISC